MKRHHVFMLIGGANLTAVSFLTGIPQQCAALAGIFFWFVGLIWDTKA